MIERRQIEDFSQAEYRAEVSPEDNKRYIMGYASLKNTPSRKITERINGELRTYTETIADTAFNDSDIRSIAHLIDHDPGKIVGRSGVNTTVSVTERGLFFRTQLPEEGKATSIQEDLYRNSQQGIIKGASFAFKVAEGGDDWFKRGSEWFRTINRIERVADVTSTYMGAYDSAFTFTRNLDESKIKEFETETKPAEPDNTEATKTLELDLKLMVEKQRIF